MPAGRGRRWWAPAARCRSDAAGPGAPSAARLLQLAAAVEVGSEHPLGERAREYAYLVGIALVALGVGVTALYFAQPGHDGTNAHAREGAMAPHTQDSGMTPHTDERATDPHLP